MYLEAWDPEAMHTWVKKTYHAAREGSYEGKWAIETASEGKTYKIELDMTERETPEGPFWI